MFGNRSWPAAAAAAGLVALAVLIGYGREESVASKGETPSRPVADLPAQPASILRPDPLDAPAATSVLDAQRAEEMNQAMNGAHGGHGGPGVGIYRHVDAGRSTHGAAGEESVLYVCPMHPEVTSKTPGSCPKCGMTLVERRKE